MEKRMDSKRQWMATSRLKTRSPFKDLFPSDERVINAVANHMKENGYDVTHPIAIWIHPENGQEIVIDGHLRLSAAKQIKLSPVYVARMSFTDLEAALQYAIHNQRDRRNLTDAEIFKCIETVDKRTEIQKGKNGKFTVASSEATAGKSAETTARMLGTSRTKVEKARAIIDHADKETKQEVLSGTKSLHKAYTETRERRSKTKNPLIILSEWIDTINKNQQEMKNHIENLVDEDVHLILVPVRDAIRNLIEIRKTLETKQVKEKKKPQAIVIDVEEHE